jgi:hypothetical protein
LSDVIEAAAARAGAQGVTLEDSEFDVLYCGAVAQANGGPGGNMGAAIRWLRALRAAALRRLETESGRGGSAAGLLWPAVELELELLRRLGRMSERAALAGPGLQRLGSHPGVPPKPDGLRLAAR